MSFDIIKNYMVNRLQGLGYVESKSPFDFNNATANEYNTSFILAILEGSVDPAGENINIRLYDNQVWQVSIAFSKSAQNDVIKRDEMYRSIEAIIKDLDDPENYNSTVRLIRYLSWTVEESDNYFLLKIKFLVQDQYNY